MSWRYLVAVSLVGTGAWACSDSVECFPTVGEGGGAQAPCAVTRVRTSTSPEQACFEQPQVCPSLAPIRFCSRLGGSSTPVNITLDNRGEAPLTIKSVKIRGNERCAFKAPQFSPELNTPIEPGSSLVLRFRYEPPMEAGSDFATLEIESDAENFPVLQIRTCGGSVTSTRAINPTECLACEAREEAPFSDCFM